MTKIIKNFKFLLRARIVCLHRYTSRDSGRLFFQSNATKNTKTLGRRNKWFPKLYFTFIHWENSANSKNFAADDFIMYMARLVRGLITFAGENWIAHTDFAIFRCKKKSPPCSMFVKHWTRRTLTVLVYTLCHYCVISATLDFPSKHQKEFLKCCVMMERRN